MAGQLGPLWQAQTNTIAAEGTQNELAFHDAPEFGYTLVCIKTEKIAFETGKRSTPVRHQLHPCHWLFDPVVVEVYAAWNQQQQAHLQRVAYC